MKGCMWGGSLLPHCRRLLAVLLLTALPLAAQDAAPAAAAQPTPPGETAVQLGTLDSTAPLPTLGEDPSRRLIINGFGVFSYDYNSNTGDNSFAPSALALSLYKGLSDHLSVFAQLTTARDAPSPFAADAGAANDTETEIDNLQLRYVPSLASGLDITVGKFDSPLAIERDDAPLNFQATSSFTFDFARPVKFSGIAVHDALSPHFELWAIAANGWDNDVDNNQAKTGALYGLWSPSLAAHIGLGVIYGGEKDGVSGDSRRTGVLTLLFQPTESLVWGGETVSGSEPGAALDGTTAQWFAQTLFAHQRFGAHWAATLRLDYLDDRDGSRTGVRQVLSSVTLSPQYLIGGGFYGLFRYLEHTTLRLPETAVRLDLRYNHSTAAVFAAHAEDPSKRTGGEATLQTVFLF
jgi:hypothetical protein